MSSPDDPTRRIPPTGPVAREREVYAEDDSAWRQQVLDRLDSLRTGLFVVGLIAVLALGLAAYTLITAEEEEDAGGGASREQVRTLEDRVDELDSRTENRASERSLNDVREEQQQIAERVEALEEQSEGGGGDTEELQQSIDQLSQQIEQLDERLTEVEERQEEQEQQQAP